MKRHIEQIEALIQSLEAIHGRALMATKRPSATESQREQLKAEAEFIFEANSFLMKARLRLKALTL
jgi:hypothetical protein